MPGYSQTLKTQHHVNPGFATFTTAKSVINPQALYILPAGALMVGDGLRFTIRGAISNIVTTPGLMNFQIKIGPTANIVVFDTGNIQLNATAHTLLPFKLDVLLTLRSDGPLATNAQFMPWSEIAGVMFTKTAAQVDGVNSESVIQEPVTAPVLGTAFDSTVANIVDLWAGFTISNAANLVRIDQYIIELLSERNQ